ncbi:MAG: G8 domain-containing protein [Planctomycetota bacterium]
MTMRNGVVAGAIGALVVSSPVLGAAAQPLLWSEAYGGLAPGSDVTIPAGENVVFDIGAAEVGELVVHGVLRFEDDEDIELVASRVMVSGGGALFEAGTPADPFEHRLAITLTEPIGDPASQPMMGYRVLGVRAGGSLQLHGASSAKASWTQIDGDVEPGSVSMRTAEATGWEIGDRIALAPSGEDAREAERLTVTAVSADGLAISFEPPLEHHHLGHAFTYAGKPIDMRAEVALLSRTIVIGNAPSDPYDKLGFHGMVMPDSGPVNVSGVEFVGGGQIARPARYPMHWHRNPALDVQFGGRGWMIEAPSRAGDWIRDCSIHSSGQRGIVIHGVNDVVVADNVVFDVWDHAYVTSEDGLEIRNRFERNLAMLVKRKDRGGGEFAFFRDDHTESDQAEHRPSGFWGRNPFNPMIGNRSAGTVEGIGFFIDSAVMGYDMSRLVQREQSKTETVVFRGNASHSNYRAGVSGAGIPTYGPKTRGHGLMIGDYNAAFDAVFEDFQTYRNSVLGVWIEDDRHTLRDAILTDSSGGFIAFRSNIEDVVFNQRSDNTLGREPQNIGNRRHPAGGLHFQSTGYGNHPNLRSVTFMNVEPAAIYMWKDPIPGYGGPTFEGIELVNTPAILHSYERERVDGAYDDLDGALSGLGVPARVSGQRLALSSVLDEPLDVYFTPDESALCTRADITRPFGAVGLADLFAYIDAFVDGDPLADFDGSGMLSIADLFVFIEAFTTGCE